MMKSKITTSILDNISNRIKEQGFSSDEGNALVLFNGSNQNISNQLEYLKSLKEMNMNISVGFSFMSERILDTRKIIDTLNPVEVFKEEDIFKLKSVIDKYSLLIGPNITINTLSKVTLGMIDSFVPNIIWSFLYHGKKVYLDFNSVRNYMGSESKSQEISNIIDNHIRTVIKMGAIEITKQNLNITIENKNSIASFKKYDNDVKELISERDIIALGKGTGVLAINKSTVVTPLAKDKARELGIKIEIN